MRDQTIYCIQCDSPFMYTVSEQKRVISQGFDAPKRCPECRKRKQKSTNSESRRKKRGRKEIEPWEIAEDED